ncbi:hypothetical protein ACFGYG_05985 [Pasteurella multocida]|uniref:hypothetical protein n=1 Tax=Pasteurella multocida TaxID=747 RepID=UPI0020242550|nr:hypothetical protein [Pasteurella multocida]URK00517.1 hypothetical protein M9414_05750 [Pasteurella multocida]HDR1860346.1 hypothetical protein [Pasteurella multocida]HDR1895340.1 hypothetical protein [Pasteurella multocida]
MKKLVLVGLVSALLVGCTSASKMTKVNSNVKGLVYNSVASNYTPMLTTVSLLDFDDGSQALNYRSETYKRDNYGNIQTVNVTIPNTSLEQHLELLNKFIDWDIKAKARAEQFDKEIGRAKTTNGYSVYTFHSGSKYSNFLDICFVISEGSPCMIESITFDVQNVKNIIQDLTKFKSGGFKHVDTSVYQ